MKTIQDVKIEFNGKIESLKQNAAPPTKKKKNPSESWIENSDESFTNRLYKVEVYKNKNKQWREMKKIVQDKKVGKESIKKTQAMLNCKWRI